MKTAWVFPGQGSQVLGMGVDLLALDRAKATFDRAAEILGWSVVDICQNDEVKLANTRYKQRGAIPDAVAGHSLGEYVALYAAEVFDFETGLELVKHRAQLMDLASDGGMTALIGFDRDQLATAIADTDDVVIANDNSTAQVVISGTAAGIAALVSKIKVKRAIPLNVSGAFHSPMMAAAATEFGKLLAPIQFHDAKIPVLSNVAPTATTDGSRLKAQLDSQITGAVRWREISLQLTELGIEQAIEVGPGKVLGGLIKRTCDGISTLQMGTRSDLAAIFPN
jgi:[acyl-carrier-protein] S-malonyltransferase